jgi:hypothetical protein
MSFQKAGNFSKITRYLEAGFLGLSRASPSCLESSLENRMSSRKSLQQPFIPKVVVSRSKLRTLQDLCHWKVGIASFPEIPKVLETDIRIYVNQKWEKQRKQAKMLEICQQWLSDISPSRTEFSRSVP